MASIDDLATPVDWLDAIKKGYRTCFGCAIYCQYSHRTQYSRSEQLIESLEFGAWAAIEDRVRIAITDRT